MWGCPALGIYLPFLLTRSSICVLQLALVPGLPQGQSSECALLEQGCRAPSRAAGLRGVLGCLPLPGARCHSSLEPSPNRGGKGQRLINWKSLQAARNVVCRKFILLLGVERSDYLGIGSFPHCCAISVTQIGAGAEGC